MDGEEQLTPGENTPVLEGVSPKLLLAEWANAQDAWVRSLAIDVLATRKPLGDAQIEAAFEIYLREKGFDDQLQEEVPTIETGAEGDTVEQILRLNKIENVQGVNALATGHVLEFDDGLTVIFGQNGAGKTGYSRIIKCVANARTADDILSNAHATTEQPVPSASITYSLDGSPTTVEWENERGVAPLTRISVFDTSAVALHTDNELGYVFVPSELALFSSLSEAIKAVQQLIADRAAELSSPTNPLMGYFARGTEVYTLIESLGAATELADIDGFAQRDGDTAELAAQLAEEIAALRANSTGTIVETTRQKHGAIKVISDLLGYIANFDASNYTAKLAAYKTTHLAYKKARDDLFKEGELVAPVDDEWQEFIAAGETYREHLEKHDYPKEGEPCFYCGQTLSKDAAALVKRYQTLLDDSFEEQLRDARLALKNTCLNEDNLNGSNIEGSLRLLQADKEPSWVKQAEEIIKTARQAAEVMASRKSVTVPDLASSAATLNSALQDELAKLVKTIGDLTKDKDETARVLATKSKEHAELSARLELRKHLATAKAYVNSSKDAAKLRQLSGSISTILRSLTEQTKLASQDLVNRNFEELFNEEREALNAPMVSIEFVGRSGSAERRKEVANHRPSQILSEGEQKVLAISDFLAESRMGLAKAPIVFDDPVTSLDYRRLEEVADRIAHLADEQQVVVFTHNIMFAAGLLARRSSRSKRCNFYEVTDDGDAKGIIGENVEPKMDTPKDIAKKIEGVRQALGSADAITKDVLIKRGYGFIRSWCEVFVEQELLANVSQRYRPNVMMGGLANIKADRLEVATTAVNEVFDRACRFIDGHSQPNEQQNIKPTPAELDADWQKLKDARSAYIAD